MNTSFPLAIAALALAAFSLSAATLYVSLESTNPAPPYATWETAATVIQDAVDAARAGDTVLVTNGVYAVGSREVLTFNPEWEYWESMGLSRVVVTNSIRLESVNGPLVTIVEGMQPDQYGDLQMGVRCVYLGSNAVMSGFSLTRGFAYGYTGGVGGGVLCELSAVVTNCALRGNHVDDVRHSPLSHLARGGGAYNGTLYNCTLDRNAATMEWSRSATGGGAANSTLYNCTVTGNYGDGAWRSTLYNCTVAGNSG